MMNNVKAILFDLDGTILDTREFILQATEHVLKNNSYPIAPREKISKLVGKPFDEYYFILTGLKDNKHLQDEHRQFQFSNLHLSTLYPGAKETLRKLREKGLKMAIVSTRSKKTTHLTLKESEIDDLFNVTISGEDAPHLKPDPAPLNKALEELEELPENAVMVGDSHLDIEAGKNARVRTIRATYGFHKDNLHNPEPDFFIDDISQLIGILAG